MLGGGVQTNRADPNNAYSTSTIFVRGQLCHVVTLVVAHRWLRERAMRGVRLSSRHRTEVATALVTGGA